MSLARLLALLSFSAAAAVSAASGAEGTGGAKGVWIIRNARVVPVSGPPLARAAILVRDGRIEQVGPAVEPPAGAQEIDASGLTAYPGLIDLHTTLAQPAELSESESPRIPPQPMATAADHLRAVAAGVTPAWQARSVLRAGAPDLQAARSAGVTLALSVPRQGIVPGTGVLIRTAGEKADELPVPGPAPLYFQFTARRGSYPSTLMGILAAQRQALLDAEHYRLRKSRNPSTRPDAAFDALQPLLRGERPAFLAASREREIRRALRLGDEFGMRAVLVGGGEAGRLAAELKARGTPVLFALGALAAPPAAGRPAPAETPAELLRAGVPVALTSQGLEGYGALMPLVRRLLAAGVSEDQALRAMTLTPAEILGIADRFGSIAAGRSADLVLADGPLFDPGTRIRRVFIGGRSFQPASPAAPARARGDMPPGASAPPTSPPPAPDSAPVLIRHATLLTVTRGTIRNGSILVRDGKIAALGPDGTVTAPPGARVIDARGMWVMPGIVDAHSHMAIEGGINEGTYAVTPEVRVLDVINPRDVTIYRALAGGVTTAHLMHGSANVIGGQNAIIKLKWGADAEAMVPVDAPRTVKFALGENPKRSNSSSAPSRTLLLQRPASPTAPGGAAPGSAGSPPAPGPPGVRRRTPAAAAATASRYPTTRMGVENVLRECFSAARAYRDEWEAYRQAAARGEKRVPPRRDLRLEALADIQAGRILVQAHSYRADEILMLLRLAEEFGFRIRTLHHALEAYKVAPQVARHGAGVSTFADHWAYKVEAFDAIPHNAALCARAGIPVSINSDSGERVRRLYWEAAKTMKYGGMTETQALKTITLYPAWQLGMDHRIGSLEVGKDADLAVFSSHPFSPAARCEMTLIEGKVFFDRKKDLSLRGKPGYPAPDAEGGFELEDGECRCDALE